MRFARTVPSIALCALLHTVASVSRAAEPDDDWEARRLLELLEKETEVATKTRLNADYVPGILTVLYGKDLEAKGVRTVAEALETIPGVQIVRDRFGYQQIVVRGVSSALLSGNVKVLLDDIPANSTRTGMAYVLNTPMEIIDRIEMVRGPGSAVHGEYAYAGVINIVTRDDGQRLYVSLDDQTSLGAGAVLGWSALEKDARASLSFGSWRSDGSDMRSGPDALYNDPNTELSNAPGLINDDFDNLSAAFKAEYRKFALNAHYVDENQGEYYGVNYILPEDDGTAIRNRTGSIQARQRFDLSDRLQVDAKFRVRETLHKSSLTYLGPPEIFGFSGDTPVLWDSHYEERESGGEINWLWRGSENHLWLLGLGYSETEVLAADYRWNVDEQQSQTTDTLRPYPFADALLQKGTRRRVTSVTLQDEARLSPQLSLTAGARYDHYSDAGDHIAPRLAAVWRQGSRHIFKAQYATAFRPPAFSEAATAEPATVKTFEVAYINKGVHAESRVTLFDSTLNDLIAFSESSGYTNVDRVRSYGIELEHEHSLNASLQWHANLSYSHSEDEATGEPLAGTSDWLGNLEIVAHPLSRLTIATTYRVVGPFHREALDARDELPGYQVIDLTATWRSAAGRGLTYRLGIRNLFDEDVRHPAVLTINSEGQLVPGYPEDLPTEDRLWWAQLSYHY